MDIILNPHANYNASSFVLVVAALAAAVLMGIWARRYMIELGMDCRELFSVPSLRMVTGAVCILVGVAFGSAMWLPAFPLLISGNEPLSAWYIVLATWPANIFNLVSVIGLSIILWPLLKARLGAWAIPAVLGITAAVYSFGVVGSMIAGEWLKLH